MSGHSNGISDEDRTPRITRSDFKLADLAIQYSTLGELLRKVAVDVEGSDLNGIIEVLRDVGTTNVEVIELLKQIMIETLQTKENR